MRPVGILGGMGPEATILLMQKVLRAVEARDDADHLPLIVHQNPQVPSRIAALIDGSGADPAPVLAGMARDLARAGAEALAMPCNTAHHYAGAVREASDLPFLDMLALTTAALSAKGVQRVGMLASPALRKVGVCAPYFESAGLLPIWGRDEDEMLAIIRAVKAGVEPGALEARLNVLAADVKRDGADHLLVACTELSLLTGGLGPREGWTDSLDCLVTGIVVFARGGEESPT
ncbi:amino acid racemase [Roseovarius sp. SCSIO 43702]|uniref:aspartate/glutamate racemase family protein n=1 Tax=Roseovarius sp. SCSIO 43702 TaxID=2823043 RepID=UPI001C739AD3|nr:amino acid racemase [Roseovarius sp. SCSIO 43702]QYX57834.1 amino acid racemase [Roseovarius sp. SCSIO 43702]